MFEIAFTQEPAFQWDGHGPLHRWGFTILGDHSERFAAPLIFWNEDDYQAQWRQGVRRLVDGAEVSALITVLDDPVDGGTCQFWELYRLSDAVAVQERLWLPEFGALDPNAAHDYVAPYRRENYDATR